MKTSARLLLAALAVYRAALLVSSDAGPLYALRSLRRAVGRWATRGGRWRVSVAEGLHCPYCVGVWLALPVAALVLHPSRPGDALLVWLGLAGAQAWLQNRMGRR